VALPAAQSNNGIDRDRDASKGGRGVAEHARRVHSITQCINSVYSSLSLSGGGALSLRVCWSGV